LRGRRVCGWMIRGMGLRTIKAGRWIMRIPRKVLVLLSGVCLLGLSPMGWAEGGVFGL